MEFQVGMAKPSLTRWGLATIGVRCGEEEPAKARIR